ncbi:MAG: DUF547 domain-containing protein [Pseudomonadota bacterium]
MASAVCAWRRLGIIPVTAGGAVILALAGCAGGSAPQVETPFAFETRSDVAVDHKPWDDFLATYVAPGPDGSARVAYGAVTDVDRRALAFYVARQSRVRVDALSRTEQFAFWANLHNAAVVDAVLSEWPVDRFDALDLGQPWFRGPERARRIVQRGRLYAFDDIRERVLRPLFRDARLHFALSLAAIGDPDLGPRAFSGEDLDAQLTDAARRFVNHPRGAALRADGAVAVSALFFRHLDDFGGDDAGLRAWLARYAAGPLATRLAAGATLTRLSWDGRINLLIPTR